MSNALSPTRGLLTGNKQTSILLFKRWRLSIEPMNWPVFYFQATRALRRV
jgi:hypothetical protein